MANLLGGSLIFCGGIGFGTGLVSEGRRLFCIIGKIIYTTIIVGSLVCWLKARRRRRSSILSWEFSKDGALFSSLAMCIKGIDHEQYFVYKLIELAATYPTSMAQFYALGGKLVTRLYPSSTGGSSSSSALCSKISFMLPVSSMSFGSSSSCSS